MNLTVWCWCRSRHDDAAIRVKLLGLLTWSPSNCRHWQQLGRDVIAELVSRHREMLGRQGRCYANSVQHRRSHRVVTAVLLLENFTASVRTAITDAMLINSVFAVCISAVQSELTGLMCGWLVMRFFCRRFFWAYKMAWICNFYT